MSTFIGADANYTNRKQTTDILRISAVNYADSAIIEMHSGNYVSSYFVLSPAIY